MMKKIRDNKLLWLIVISLIISLFININTVELRAEEPRRAVVAMEMFLKGEYIVPYANGWNYYNKPPLFNWILIFFFEIFEGFDEWIIRTPSLIAFLLMGWLTYLFGKRFINEQTGILGALFFLTSADILFYGTATSGEIDLLFSFLVLLQVFSIFLFFNSQQYLLMFLISYFLAASGVLTKGLPSLVFQAFTLLGWLWYNKRIRLLFSWQHLGGIILFCIIILVYFNAYSTKGDEHLFIANLIEESLKKSALDANTSGTLRSIFLFPLECIKFLLPWSLILLCLITRKSLQQKAANSFLKFCLVFIAFNIAFYWITGEARSRYIYMFFPFMTIYIAHIYHRIPANNGIYLRLIQLFGVLIGTSAVTFAIIPFLEVSRNENVIVVSALLLSLSLGYITFLYARNKYNPVYLLVLSIILIRIGMGFIYYPLYDKQSTSLVYRENVNRMKTLTGNERIYLYGKMDTIPVSPVIDKLLLQGKKIIVPQMMPYQIPYYLSKNDAYIVEFDTEIKTGRLYIAYEDMVKAPAEILYRFKETWFHKEMVLFTAIK